MKKIGLIFSFLFLSISSHAEIVYITDNVFRAEMIVYETDNVFRADKMVYFTDDVFNAHDNSCLDE